MLYTNFFPIFFSFSLTEHNPSHFRQFNMCVCIFPACVCIFYSFDLHHHIHWANGIGIGYSEGSITGTWFLSFWKFQAAWRTTDRQKWAFVDTVATLSKNKHDCCMFLSLQLDCYYIFYAIFLPLLFLEFLFFFSTRVSSYSCNQLVHCSYSQLPETIVQHYWMNVILSAIVFAVASAAATLSHLLYFSFLRSTAAG